MKRSIRLLSALLALVLCALPLFTCLAEDAAASDGDVLVLINGEAVTRGEMNTYRTSIMNYYAQYGYDVNDEAMASYFNEYALNVAIEYALIGQKAVDLGLTLTDEEIEEVKSTVSTQWAGVIDTYLQYYGGLAEDASEEETAAAKLNVVAMLESAGYTESSLLEDAIQGAQFDKVYAEIVKDVAVTDEEIEAAYQAHVAEDQASYENDIGTYEYMTQYYGATSYYTPAGYRGVTHILLEVDQELLDAWSSLSAALEEQQEAAENPDPEATEDADADAEETAAPVTQAEVDAAYAAIIASVQPTIDEINQKLADGVPFADLVAEYGTDPGMTQEPNKTDGYPVHMDSIIWDPAFVKGAFSVDEVGQIAEPVVGSYGVHIIQYTRDVPAGPVALTDELRATISEEVRATKENDVYRAAVETWLAEADVVYSAEAQALLPVESTEDAAE